MEKRILFTSEAVSEGHPDKVCDQIADAVLDECLAHDPDSRVACEVLASTNYVLVGGEITSRYEPDYEKIVKDVLTDIGYTRHEYDFCADDVKVEVQVKKQSPEIAHGVSAGSAEEQGAGDQGVMFGYATTETKGYMPLAISIAHKLVRIASKLRKKGDFKWARPDMKAQVSIDYADPKKPVVATVLMSIQHDPDYDEKEFRRYVRDDIMRYVVRSFGLNEDFQVLINPAGPFVHGGPASDTGLTGRKLIVDTYGAAARHGGGSFSGKDPSKVDRTGAYVARYIAKNLVAAGVAERMEVEVGYAIGRAEPVSLGFSTFGTSHYDDDDILKVINALFDLRPGVVIRDFGLTHPEGFRYRDLANYGHFGRPDLRLPWEKLDKVEAIKAMLEGRRKSPGARSSLSSEGRE